ncbi:glutamate ABC transporter substrate-binding protein [Amycolatopsis methanolica]|uniref:Periplasmic component of amino acid ABC-type transporter/signal transduction system n=1 Tax=Amycolatopsis methanolica 239 TaxID=1068978 RepID=A0A076MZL5_AMYME|nr:glutamate ABC transporter substrate-binding protein [Amycolatopsis methanolica]AIJ26799.1 Periplasmic component of amino acid ABC-type transporter/signal transduction system [Amycolatopsis methanolica 239]
MARGKVAALVAAVALLAAGCGSAGTPADPAPVGDVRAPLPAGVGGGDTGSGSGADNSCDTRSLSPNGSIPSGSTMDKIRDRGRLIAGVDQTNFLFGFLNPSSGNLEGFDIEIVKQIAASIFGRWEGHIQWVAIPSSAREDVLKDHQVDIVVRTYSITCTRMKDVAFSAPYYQAGQAVLAAKNSGIRGLQDLGGKRVCAAKNSTSLSTISTAPSRPVPVSVNNWSDCLVLIQQGQVDAISTDDVILAGMARQDPNLEVVGEPFTREFYGVGIPRGQDDMVRFVNAVLENVRNGGAWQNTYKYWIEPALGPGSPPSVSYR